MRRRTAGKNRFLRVTALAIIVVFAVVCMKRLDPYVENRAKYEAKNAVSGVISAAAYSVFDEQSNSYDDFAAVIYDENGRVCSIEMLTAEISKMQSLLSNEIYKELKKIEDTEIEVSIGDISGFFLLFNRGIDIKVKIDSVGSVFCDIESEFSQSGVNQTCHSIYFNISAAISVVFPFECVETTVNVKYLAAQTVIVGEVPQLYA